MPAQSERESPRLELRPDLLKRLTEQAARWGLSLEQALAVFLSNGLDTCDGCMVLRCASVGEARVPTLIDALDGRR